MNNPFPSEIFTLILVIGAPLAFLWPKPAFFTFFFLTCALPGDVLTFTRLSGIGPWFNLRDACLIFALVSSVVYVARNRRKIQLPLAIIGIIILTLLGGIHSYVAYSPDFYLFARLFRLYLNFPLFFIAGVLIVDRESDSRWLIRAVVIGSVIVSILYLVSLVDTYTFDGIVYYRNFRQLSFGSLLIPWVAISLIIWVLTKQITSRRYQLAAIAAVGLHMVVILLQQTRSIWLSTMIVFLVIFFTLLRESTLNLKVIIKPGRIVLFVILLSFGLVLGNRFLGTLIPGLSFQSLIENRAAADDAGRSLAVNIEFQTWLESTLIWGNGLGYTNFSNSPLLQELTIGISDVEIAYTHVGHIGTLSEYGLIGYLVFYVGLPLTIMRAARHLLKSETTAPETRMLAVMSLILIMWLWILFLFSGNFNGLHSFSPMLLGATWSLWYQQSLAAQASTQAPTVPAPAAATRLQPWQTRQ
jgi:hypothetical protein